MYQFSFSQIHVNAGFKIEPIFIPALANQNTTKMYRQGIESYCNKGVAVDRWTDRQTDWRMEMHPNSLMQGITTPHVSLPLSPRNWLRPTRELGYLMENLNIRKFPHSPNDLCFLYVSQATFFKARQHGFSGQTAHRAKRVFKILQGPVMYHV